MRRGVHGPLAAALLLGAAVPASPQGVRITGVSTATVSPATTVSPSRKAIRASRAATGAETVNRSFSRVRPSSSMACSKRPCLTSTASTSTGRGANAHASAPKAASATPAQPNVLLLNRIIALPFIPAS